MQCVILAAGEGKRLRPLTNDCPKPLVKVAGEAILDHIVRALPDEITELIIVVGYCGDQVRAYCGDRFHDRNVLYVEQENQLGTAHALKLCELYLTGRFLVMLGDDIHSKKDIERALQHDRTVLVAVSENPERFGVIIRNDDGTLSEIVEKPANPSSNLVSTGTMVLDMAIFRHQVEPASNGEYYLSHMLESYAKDTPVHVVIEESWIPIGYPEDIARAEDILKSS